MHTHGASLPGIYKKKFWKELQQNQSLQNSKCYKNGLEELPGVSSLLLLLYLQDFSSSGLQERVVQSFVPFFAQFNQKVLRISRFHQHQVQQPKDKLSMPQAGDSQSLFPCNSGCFKTMVALLSYSFISARPAYSEATTRLCCYMIRNFARPNPLDNKTICLKILDHKHFTRSKSISMIPYLTIWNKE